MKQRPDARMAAGWLPDGTVFYVDDIVEVIDTNGEKITDVVHVDENKIIHFGGYDGTIKDFKVVRVVGNLYENPWPENQFD